MINLPHHSVERDVMTLILIWVQGHVTSAVAAILIRMLLWKACVCSAVAAAVWQLPEWEQEWGQGESLGGASVKNMHI